MLSLYQKYRRISLKKFVTLFGKTRLNENSVIMHFQCIFNAMIMHYNALIMVLNAFLMFISPLKKLWQCSTKLKNGWKMFQNALATFSNVWSKCCTKRWKQRTTFRPVATKLHTPSTQPVALYLHTTNSTEHHNSASEKTWFCNINKEQFAATYIKTFAKQQLPWSQRFFLIFLRLRWESHES